MRANAVQLTRADLVPRAEMRPSVGWNSLLIEVFWPKLCSNGSRKGWIRLCPVELNWNFGAGTDLFNFQCKQCKWQWYCWHKISIRHKIFDLSFAFSQQWWIFLYLRAILQDTFLHNSSIGCDCNVVRISQNIQNEISLETFADVVAYQFINLNWKLNGSRKENMHDHASFHMEW